MTEQLKSVGVDSLDIDSCDTSDPCKQWLVNMIMSYEDVFLHSHLDCGKAKGFVHRIHLSDTIQASIQTCSTQPVSKAAAGVDRNGGEIDNKAIYQ